VEISSIPAVAPRDRDATLAAGWLSRPALDADGLRELPLFAALDDEQVDHVLRAAREISAGAGDVVVGQWQTSRDLLVILSGRIRVEAGGEARATLGPGAFVGELAAIDWGAGFGRARAADVIAEEPVRLLVLDWQLVARLMAGVPAFAETLEQVARERLATL
jgi:CRP-like cAMP-binding protein